MSKPVSVCSLVLLKKDNEVLLAMKKRGFGEGKWNGAGGKIKDHESIEAAMIRECREEISVTPTKFSKVAVHDFLYPKGMQDVLVHTYLANEWEGEPKESEEMAPKWFDLKSIPYKHMWADDRIWLPYVLEGRKLRCQFYFNREDILLKAAFEFVDELE